MNNIGQYREGNRLEAKSAKGGFPGSIWETYSSFANTNGGIILLGVNELKDGTLIPFCLEDAEKLIRVFWNNINNKQVVNANVLTDSNVQIVSDDDARFIVIEIPRATRQQKPIYVGKDPFSGTYRRNGQGDYHCSREDILAMLRDQAEISQDMAVLEKIGMDAINKETVTAYRRRFELQRAEHVWLKSPDDEFLIKLGAAKMGEDGGLHPTGAGLLMFGDEYQIVYEFPQYFLDYREVEPWQERWVHRFVSSSGDWSGNLFDFFYRVYNRIAQIVEVPFKMMPGGGPERVEDTPVHKAIREALANALINADYYGRQGLVVIRGQQELSLENPGGFRIPIDDAIQGGHSDPRNATLMKMFNLLEIGERAGSGIPSIFAVWQDQGWAKPEYIESFSPDRTTAKLILQKVSDDFSDENFSWRSSEKSSERVTVKEQAVLLLIAKDPSVNTSEIADKLGIPRTTVSSRIQTLKSKSVLRRVGSDRDGYWEIIVKD